MQDEFVFPGACADWQVPSLPSVEAAGYCGETSRWPDLLQLYGCAMPSLSSQVLGPLLLMQAGWRLCLDSSLVAAQLCELHLPSTWPEYYQLRSLPMSSPAGACNGVD